MGGTEDLGVKFEVGGVMADWGLVVGGGLVVKESLFGRDDFFPKPNI